MYPTHTTPADKQAVKKLLQTLESFHQELMANITNKLHNLDFNFANEQHTADLLKSWPKEVRSPIVLF